MAILRCPSCGYLQEVPNQHIGKEARCPSCQGKARIVDTLKLLENSVKQQRLFSEHLSTLKSKHAENAEHMQAAVKQHVQTSRENRALQKQLEKLREENTTLRRQLNADTPATPEEDFDGEGYAFENQDYAESLNNFQPIIEWFRGRNIQVTPNTRASDISGYFDEIAVMLGDHYPVLQPFLEQLRYNQRKGYKSANFKLEGLSQQDAKTVRDFCRSAYEFAFFNKQFYDKKTHTQKVYLQTSPTIRNFFDGDWLEWYAFMKVASLLLHRQQRFACLRSSEILFSNQEKHEIDTFFLLDDTIPLWIECKSGEFRQSIDKYQALRKRLDIPSSHAVLMVAGLEDDKVAAMSSMFGLTLVNERSLMPYISRIT